MSCILAIILGILFWVVGFAVSKKFPTKAEREAAERMKKLRESRETGLAYLVRWGAPKEFVERVLVVVARVSEKSFLAIEVSVPADRLSPDDRLMEELAYHLDSLSMLELVLALEREYKIRLRERDFDECRTVGDVVRIVAASAA